MAEREIADWLLLTLRIFGADEATSFKIVGHFLEALAKSKEAGHG